MSEQSNVNSTIAEYNAAYVQALSLAVEGLTARALTAAHLFASQATGRPVQWITAPGAAMAEAKALDACPWCGGSEFLQNPGPCLNCCVGEKGVDW